VKGRTAAAATRRSGRHPHAAAPGERATGTGEGEEGAAGTEEGWGRKSPTRGRERRELLAPGREGREPPASRREMEAAARLEGEMRDGGGGMRGGRVFF
jgi:hypothetical protein